MKALIVVAMCLVSCSPVVAPGATATRTDAPLPTVSIASPTAAPTPTAITTPTATLAAGLTRYVNTELGYSLDLPAGWRRAVCSQGLIATSPLASYELFVGVSEADEVISMGARLVNVVVADSEGLTPLAWLQRRPAQPDVRFEPTAVGGRAGARGFQDATGETFSLAFAERGWIYSIDRTYFGSPDPELERILATIRVLDKATPGQLPTASPTPRTVESVVDAVANGFARKDLTAIAETMTPCITVGGIPGDAFMRSRSGYVAQLQADFGAGTSVFVQARPIETDQYLGRFVRSTWSKAGQPDQRVDLMLRLQGDRWSVIAAFNRAPGN